MISLWYRSLLILARFGGLALLAILLVPMPGRAATAPSITEPLGVETPPFLKGFPYATVPLAASLAAQTPMVRQDEGLQPAWKRLWDEARQAVAAGNLAQAVTVYRKLLTEKEITAVRWEFATVLVALGRYREAAGDVEALADEAPNRAEYLRCLAVIDLRLGRFRAAAAAFARLQTLQPGDDSPLAGEIHALLAAGDRKAALPLVQELWRRRPASPGLREALATLAYETGVEETAWPHLVDLAKGPRPAAELLSMAARVAERLRKPEEALFFWQRYAEARPDDLEARRVLADALAKGGQLRQAMPHLLAIHKRRPDDLLVLKGIGQGYVALREYAQAVGPLTEYARKRPDDREVAELLVRVRESLGQKAETLQALERYLAVEPHPDRVTLEKAARWYEEAGAHAAAVSILRRLIPLRPDDPKILTALAKELRAAGREEEALAAWQALARLSPADISVLREMVAILEHLGRGRELYATLLRIYRLNPADFALGLRLLGQATRESDLGRAGEVVQAMEQVSGSSGAPLPSIFSYWRGMLRMKREEYGPALADLEGFLQAEPSHGEARQQALIAAGRLGELSRVSAHAQALVDQEEPSLELKLILAQAYADCRAEDEARVWFRRVVDAPALKERKAAPLLIQAYGGLSETYAREGRPYEAEEALRTGVVATRDLRFFLPRLFTLALAQGQAQEAEAWLAALRPLLTDAPWRVTLMEATLFAARGEMRQARRALRLVDEALSGQDTPPTGQVPLTPGLTADRLALAAQWQKAGKAALAAKQALQVLKVEPENLEAKVILEMSHDPLGRGAYRIDPTALRSDQLRSLGALYQRHDRPKEMARAARQALGLTPHSLSAGLLLADSLVEQGDLAGAYDQLGRLATEYPREFSLKVRIATTLFRRGEMAKAEALTDLPSARSRPELTLLRARILWRENRWDEALAVYRELLTPGVATILREESQSDRTVLPDLKRERSIWEILTRDPGPDPELLLADRVMAPTTFLSLLDQGEGRFALATARLVARYRWQAQFAMELAPRLSVVRREYTIARKQYEALLDRYPAERTVLYDLAGVYSRLGTLDQEAAAYDQLSNAGVNFPELDEARTRNRLKQRPRTSVSYGFQSEAGRHGYLDRDQEWAGLSFWASPRTRHEAEMTAERISYHAGSANDLVRATRAMASYSAGLLSGFTVKGGLGIQGEDEGDANTLLFNALAVGKVGDGLQGTVAVDREMVDDTIVSLRRQVTRQDLTGGLSLDPLPRLSVGGGYLARYYSDNNWTTGYDLWSSYLVFAEPTFLQLKYSYDFKESREGNSTMTAPGKDDFGPDDHPYWAPKNYWLNQLGLYFKHSLAEDSLDRGAPQYYTLEYALGHDVDGYLVQTAKAGLYAEFAPWCLVAATSEVVTSQAVRKEEYRLSAIYRW